jgi:hypothetical protein
MYRIIEELKVNLVELQAIINKTPAMPLENLGNVGSI